MISLPIDAVLDEVVQAVRDTGTAILVAPPGAGKTTRVPVALLQRANIDGKIVMLQPRRVAARAAARRMAEETGTPLGGTVGFRVRFEREESKSTRILVLTEGLLTRWMQTDPTLDSVGLVILDEFHERSLHADLALAMLAKVRRELRPELGIVVMSATLDPLPVSRFLSGAPVISAAGRAHPVAVEYLDHSDDRALPIVAAEGALRAAGTTARDVLVFLPGLGEIQRTAEVLMARGATRDFDVLPLHGELASQEQDAALRAGPRRRIILSTNVAETSVTVEGVSCVVDTGFARKLRHDADLGLDRLDLERISRASADQRAGRAGRLGPGTCLRLWTRPTQSGLEDEETPEIHRVDLAGTLLELRGLGVGDPRTFEWYEAPLPRDLAKAEQLLATLGLVSAETGTTTKIGEAVRRWPLHPRLGRILWESHRRGCLAEGARLCSLLSERDLFRSRSAGGHRQQGPKVRGDSDLLFRLDALEQVSRSQFRTLEIEGVVVDGGAARTTMRVAKELEDQARRDLGPSDRRAPAESDLLKLVLVGYPDRVGRRRERGGDRAILSDGTGVRIAPESIVLDHEYFVAVVARGAGTGPGDQAAVTVLSGIEAGWLEEVFPGAVRTETSALFDAKSEAVIGVERRLFWQLQLEERRGGRVPPGLTRALLEPAAAVARPPLLDFEGELGEYLERLRVLRQHAPELECPEWSESELFGILWEAVPEARSLRELRSVSLKAELQGRLAYAQRQALDREVPERFALPEGRTAAIRYERGRPPIVSARVQHWFGVKETPRLVFGRLPVLVELLAPNQRPVQLTGDLANFWRGSYQQVRKDLRGRYPKHAWPEVPPHA